MYVTYFFCAGPVANTLSNFSFLCCTLSFFHISHYSPIFGIIIGQKKRCVDVYTEVLPAAGPMFASKGRVIGNVGVGYVSDLVARLRERGKTTLATALAATIKSSNASVPVELILVNDDGDENGTEATTAPIAIIGDKVSPGSLELTNKILDTIPVLRRIPSTLSSLRPYFTLKPGMNLEFIVNGIMSSTSGLRPFDIETFRQNDAKQPLLSVSSTVRAGKMETVAFGSKEGDYWDVWVDEDEVQISPDGRIKRSVKTIRKTVISIARFILRKMGNARRRLLGRDIFVPQESAARHINTKILREATACPDNTGKKGLFACLESSMLVPGAAGPPLKLLRSKHRRDAVNNVLANSTNICFDAFACEYTVFCVSYITTYVLLVPCN